MSNNISLTSSMQSNLRALQQTASLLEQTQSRLSTGKKVNSAIDDPIAYFTARSLTDRASNITELQDVMTQAIRTINAADKGITGVDDLITQAKGIAKDAQTADNTQDSVKLTVGTAVDANEIEMGDTTFVAVSSSSSDSASAGVAFEVGDSSAETARNLATAINSNDWSEEDFTWKASVTGSVVNVEKIDNSNKMNVDAVVADITVPGTVTAALEKAEESSLESLQKEYNSLRSQMTQLAKDSGYKGNNLLDDESLVVKFENNTLDVKGFDATAVGLKITEATTWTDDVANIDADLALLETASKKLSAESAKMSNNLNTISVRQSFSTSMINTLTEGANDLVLADMNEEGAKLLMLQTQQTLAMTTLSMASQNAQSVLRLFN